MEENLAHVGSIVGNLKSMAIDMSNEIDTQKDQLERVQGKVRPPPTVTMATTQPLNLLLRPRSPTQASPEGELLSSLL